MENTEIILLVRFLLWCYDVVLGPFVMRCKLSHGIDCFWSKNLGGSCSMRVLVELHTLHQGSLTVSNRFFASNIPKHQLFLSQALLFQQKQKKPLK